MKVFSGLSRSSVHRILRNNFTLDQPKHDPPPPYRTHSKNASSMLVSCTCRRRSFSTPQQRHSQQPTYPAKQAFFNNTSLTRSSIDNTRARPSPGCASREEPILLCGTRCSGARPSLPCRAPQAPPVRPAPRTTRTSPRRPMPRGTPWVVRSARRRPTFSCRGLPISWAR